MKTFHILMLSTFLSSSAAVYAEPTGSSAHEFQLSSDADNVEVEDFDLSLAEEESEEFEAEILSLEEELKKDAESLLDVATQPAAPVVEPAAEAVVPPSPAVEMVSESVSEPAAAEMTSLGLEVEEPVVIEKTVSTEAPSVEETTEVLKTSMMEEAPAVMEVPSDKKKVNSESPIEVNLERAFAGSPIIYSVLFVMSIVSLSIWFYNLFALRRSSKVSDDFLKTLRNKLTSNQFEDAVQLCALQKDVFSKMIISGIHSRRHGLPVMLEAMKAEGKRASVRFWERMSLLNDIAIIAPMIGLLGTVLGMFYAFYDINRSIESISTLFDGLGVSVGTTVAGLVVAILALILHSTAKYRLVRTLARVENEAHVFAELLDDRTSIYNKG